MNWNAVTAIGTILAACVGIAGIWLNLWEKTKKLDINFEVTSSIKIYLSNNSLRTIVITKMMYYVKKHMFNIEQLVRLNELSLPPATTQTQNLIKQDIYDAYCNSTVRDICNPKDKVKIILCDNYGRKYTIKTHLSIDDFKG